MKLSAFHGAAFRQYAVVIIVNLCVLPIGLNIAWTSPVLVKLSDATSSVLGRPITENEGSWIVSLYTLTAFIAILVASYIIEKVGRKYTLIGATIPRIIGHTMVTFASDVWMIYFARCATGVSDGWTMSVIPVYAAELASTKIRGSLGTIAQICSSLGIVTMLCIGPFLDYFTLNIIMLSLSILTAIPIIFLPDSPYFLYRNDKHSEALKVLTFLRKSDLEAKAEIKEYSLQKDEKATFLDIFKSKTVLKTVFLATVIGAGSQLTGYNGVSFYLQTILESTNTSLSSQIASVIIGVIQLVASLVTAVTIDRFGRKPIICSSLLGLAIGMGGLAVFYKLTELKQEIVGALNFLPLVSLVIIVYSYSAGMGSLTSPLLSELFEGRFRAIGVTIGLFFTALFGFIITKFMMSWTSTLGPTVLYSIFCGNTLVFCAFILFFVPETKGRSFAEIQAALKGRKSVVASCENSNKLSP